eukprot:2029488-Rhodomonas_salina.1
MAREKRAEEELGDRNLVELEGLETFPELIVFDSKHREVTLRRSDAREGIPSGAINPPAKCSKLCERRTTMVCCELSKENLLVDGDNSGRELLGGASLARADTRLAEHAVSIRDEPASAYDKRRAC